jgi:hypothetical protein
METTPSNRSKRKWKKPEVVGGNGLFDRRAFLRGGAVFAAAMTGYTFCSNRSRGDARGRSMEQGAG